MALQQTPRFFSVQYTLVWPKHCSEKKLLKFSVMWFLNLCWLVSHLTHWGRVTHLCISKSTTIGLDNGLSPGRHQAINWTNAGILLIEPLNKLQWNFNRNLYNFIQENAFENVVWKTAAILSRPQCVEVVAIPRLYFVYFDYIFMLCFIINFLYTQLPCTVYFWTYCIQAFWLYCFSLNETYLILSYLALPHLILS